MLEILMASLYVMQIKGVITEEEYKKVYADLTLAQPVYSIDRLIDIIDKSLK